MNNFEELESNWNNQPEIQATEKGFQEVLNGLRKIKNKQRITNAVLISTAIILVVFFFYISGYSNQQVILGISLMVGSLLVRILFEVLSIRKLRQMNAVAHSTDFRNGLIGYYKGRKFVHFGWTPLLVLIYIAGFLILLPLFKANLSSGFYIYIVVSSIVLLIILSIFIAKQIRTELSNLKRLQEEYI
ncbi:MAG: hypothetical protein ACJAU2_000199 [Maribacter sp.]|jgi:hypothetical protein